MRKGLVHIMLILSLLLAAGGCSRPKTIPKKTLKEIFKDAFLVNAYYESQPLMRMNDSTDLYRPILARYGYTVNDLENTMNRFARQKSAKISDVVEDAIQELKDRSDYLTERMAMFDTITAQAGRIFMREVLYEPQITVNQVKDTAKLRITVPAEEGSYQISYSYSLDSLEQNRGLRAIGHTIDTAGHISYIYELNNLFSQGQSRAYTSPKIAVDRDKRELQLVLGNYPQKNMKHPHLTIDSLRITYFLPDSVALDSLARSWFHLNIPYNDNRNAMPQGRGPLRPNPVGVDTVGISDPR